ncbi:hypothetical protein E0Z10_g1200 [Xylaria hypoxylon]|uniref:Rhodopsin domain-containing protein n=1 Tax=Xylaria hypoxylon TaxID=37992 RepID=A0A4Z0YUA0_9PEZI|nr:hypothetical protein E0Z10_g1200 [Xylaria hypoxylon]
MPMQNPLPQGGVDEIAVTTLFLLFAIIAVIARFWSRSIQKKGIWIDDYLIVASLIFTTATVGVGYALVLNGGVGLHMADASEEQVAISLKLFVPAPLLWAISTAFLKLSILFFYISLFTIPRIRMAVYIVIILTTALIVAVIFESFLLCRPFAYTWDKTIKGGMPIRKKLVISAILGFGLVICGLTAARISSVLGLKEDDFTYSVVPDLIFGALEIELGIVNACLPILRPLVSKLFGGKPPSSKDWSNNSEMNSEGSKTYSKSRLLKTRSFERLPDDSYPLNEAATGLPSNKTIAQAHMKSIRDLEVGEQPVNGDIMVRKDLYIYRTPTRQAPTDLEAHSVE